MRIRFTIVLSGFALLFVSLIANLYRIQIEHGTGYAARAASQVRSSGILHPHRGSIFMTDRAGAIIPAAINKSYQGVFAVPPEIADVPEAAQQLGAILDIKPAVLEKQLSAVNKYQPLASQLTEEQVAELRDLDLSGVYIDSEERRFYPSETLAAHVLGFVGKSDGDEEALGRYGIEAMFEKDLSGVNGEVSEKGFIAPVDGKDISLTIDRNIQGRAETILSGLVETFNAAGGSIIVQEPSTGKILAMAGAPTFDPNHYGKSSLSTFLNTSVQSIYEPGSVFKVLTMAAGIDSGTFTPDTVITDTGSLKIGDKTITNWDHKSYGKITMTEVIEHSINTGAAQAARLVGRDTLVKYFESFGVEEKTGIELPGEVSGSLKSVRVKDAPVNLATAAFGQGVSVTPLRLITAISALANGGVLMRPYLTTGTQPHEVRRVVKKETADMVTGMMVSAVRKAGVGQVASFTVAGKTGTAQVPDFKRGGYSGDFIHSFVGFAPASNPRFTILIKLDKPPKGIVAGTTVVPAFRELAQFLLGYYNISPDAMESDVH